MTGFIDREAFGNPLGERDPAAKLLVATGSLLLIAASPSPVAPVAIGLLVAACTVRRGGVPLRTYAAYLSLPLSFGLVTVALLLFLHGGGEPLYVLRLPLVTLAVTGQGFDAASLVLGRVLGGTAALLFLALTTPPTRVFAALRRVGVPPHLADVAFLTYRYTFLLLDEASRARRAQRARAATRDWRGRLRSATLLAGTLFLTTYEKGEALDRAMRSRCHDGEMPTRDPDPDRRDLAAALLFLACAATTALLTRGLTATRLLELLGAL